MEQLHAEQRAQRDQHLAETAVGRSGSAVAAKGGGGGAALAAEAERAALGYQVRKGAQADAKQQALVEAIAVKEARAETRRNELVWERQRKKVINETRTLQHELRKASADESAQVAALKAQRDAMVKQANRESHLQAREAEKEKQGALRSSRESTRKAEDEVKASSDKAAREEMMHERNERAASAAEQRQRRVAAERKATAKLKQLKTHAALHRCRAEEEQRRAQLQIHVDTVQQAAKDARESRRTERGRPESARERRTDHEENLARLKKAESFKRLRAEESIARKEGVTDQRRQQAQSLESERRRREVMESRLKVELQQSLDAEVRALAGGASLDPAAAATNPAVRPVPAASRAVWDDVNGGGGGGGGGGYGGGGAATARPARPARPSSAPPRRDMVAAEEAEAAARAAQKVAAERAVQARARARDRLAATREKRDDGDRGGLAAVERMRREQNQQLLAELRDEEDRDAQRKALLGETPSGPDRERLLKICEMERSRASSNMMSLTAEHELALAQRMAELGMTR